MQIIAPSDRSLTKLATQDRLAYWKLTDVLEQFGLVKSEMTVNAGHGRVRIVKSSNKDPVTLQIKFYIAYNMYSMQCEIYSNYKTVNLFEGCLSSPSSLC